MIATAHVRYVHCCAAVEVTDAIPQQNTFRIHRTHRLHPRIVGRCLYGADVPEPAAGGDGADPGGTEDPRVRGDRIYDRGQDGLGETDTPRDRRGGSTGVADCSAAKGNNIASVSR